MTLEKYNGPPDYIPDKDLSPASLAVRRAAGRSHATHPHYDWDSKKGLVPRGGIPSPHPFFSSGNIPKKEDK